MKSVLTIILALFITCARGQERKTRDINIIPKPALLIPLKSSGTFSIGSKTKIFLDDHELLPSSDFLRMYLKRYFNLDVDTTSLPKENSIRLTINNGLGDAKNTYHMLVDSKGVSIKGNSPQAVFYGIQTLIQLLPEEKINISVPYVMITDYPRFEYRGMHLDVSRHFFDVAFIKKYIDYLAFHKMNYFHWHLTDDQGWRLEIKKYPKLTEIGAWRKGTIVGLFPGKGNEHIRYQVLEKEVRITPKDAMIKTDGIRYGGYYTQDEVRDIIKYAADRYITIIPEIEMPAHSMAALAAYPELGTNPQKKPEVAQTWGIFNKQNNVLQPTEKTFNFLEDVLMEVMELFPSPYIHIGGDEASKIWWRQSAEAQQIKAKNNLKDESALQSYFIHRMEKFVNSKGKTIIGWDEILDGGLAPNAIVMSWRGEKGGITAAKLKQKVIMSPETKLYLNHAQFMKEDSLTAAKYLDLATVYNYDPVPSELNPEQAKYIWGAQGNLWTEYITNPEKVEYMLFPRMDAVAEMTWSPQDGKDYADFLKRLKSQFKRYDRMGINYSRRYLEK